MPSDHSDFTAWLRAHGFRDDPFANRDAAQEAESLERYFVAGPTFDAIRGTSVKPRTCFVFGDRGSGKTAYRVMIQRACQPHNATSDILVVPYTQNDFKQPLSKTNTTIDDHLRAILGIATRELLLALIENYNTFHLEREDLPFLIWFAQYFAPDVLGAPGIWEELRQSSGFQATDHASVLHAIENSSLRVWLEEKGTISVGQRELFAALEDVPPQQPERASHLRGAFSAFVALVRRTGLSAVYVLVDEVECINQGIEFILPLFANSDVLQTPGTAFKIFLPLDLRPLLESHVRLDLFNCYELQWDQSLLGEILKQRLFAFHLNGAINLGELATPGLTQTLDHKLIEWSAGSPRRMLHAGDALLEAHARKDISPETSLTQEDVNEVADSFRERTAPRLSLDLVNRKVAVGKRTFKPHPKEFALLTHLTHLDSKWV